ncbi:MAG: hypothetical protein KC618_06395 [Candidatus Omnitrophica bacterium]|nr:hypothetical protein [Candidatus Omnitrophota bacterium]
MIAYVRQKIQLRKQRRGFVLPACLFLMVFIGGLIVIAFSRSDMQMNEADSRIASQEAFYAAESGVERMLFELRMNPAWRPESVNLDKTPAVVETAPGDPNSQILGSYTLTTTNGAPFSGLPTVWVRAEGRSATNTLLTTDVRRVILSRIVVASPAEFFASTLGDLVIGSGARYDDDIFGRDVEFRVNPSATPKEIVVDGTVFFRRGVSGDGHPDVTITGGTQQSPPITFAGVDLPRYESEASAGGAVINGDANISGTIDRASLGTSNGLYYVKGDVYINGTFTEPILIVAEGNIYIEGNLDNGAIPADPSLSPEDVSQLGLFAAQDVIIPEGAPDDLDIEAFVMADGQNGADGVLIAEPKVGGKGTLNFTGSMSVRGNNSGTTAINLSAYPTRNYAYNDALPNGVLPFIPYIANVLEWQEPDPGQDALPTTP